MKRIIPMALVALTLSGGVALADRGRWRDTSDHSGGVVVTPTNRYDDRRHDRRYDNRRYDNARTNHRHRVVTAQRARPTFRNNRFYFSGGHYQQYQRPVIRHRYRNYYERPAVVVENIQPVSGYVWSPGQWEWDGYEWQWIPGHYDVDTSYQQQSYDYNNNYDTNNYNNYNNYDDDDDDDDDDDTEQEPVYYNNNTYRAPAVQGGLQVQGSWNF